MNGVELINPVYDSEIYNVMVVMIMVQSKTRPSPDPWPEARGEDLSTCTCFVFIYTCGLCHWTLADSELEKNIEQTKDAVVSRWM